MQPLNYIVLYTSDVAHLKVSHITYDYGGVGPFGYRRVAHWVCKFDCTLKERADAIDWLDRNCVHAYSHDTRPEDYADGIDGITVRLYNRDEMMAFVLAWG